MQTVHLTHPFTFYRLDNALRIRGTLLAEGKWCGLDRHPVYYPRDVIQKAAPTIIGKPIKYGHSDRAEAVVGFVTAAEVADSRIDFEGYIFDKETIEEIESGRINGISMEALVSTEDGPDGPVAKEITFQAAALVLNPACEVCRVETIVPVFLEEKEGENMAEDFWKKVRDALVKADIDEATADKVIEVLKGIIQIPYPYPQPKKQEDVQEQSATPPEPEDIELPEDFVELAEKPSRRQFLNWLRRQFKQAGLDADTIKKVMAVITKAIKTPYPYPYPSPKKMESPEDDERVKELESELETLKTQLEDYRKKEIERLVADIREFDESFDAESFLEGVEDHDLRVRMLEKHLETVKKFAKQKVALQVDATSELEQRVRKVLQNMGISDVKAFLEER